MDNNRSTKLPVGLIAAGLGAIGGALSVLLARKESRERILEQSAKGLEYVNQASAKLRQRTEGIVGKGRELMSSCCAAAEQNKESASRAEPGAKPEMH